MARAPRVRRQSGSPRTHTHPSASRPLGRSHTHSCRAAIASRSTGRYGAHRHPHPASRSSRRREPSAGGERSLCGVLDHDACPRREPSHRHRCDLLAGRKRLTAHFPKQSSRSRRLSQRRCSSGLSSLRLRFRPIIQDLEVISIISALVLERIRSGRLARVEDFLRRARGRLVDVAPRRCCDEDQCQAEFSVRVHPFSFRALQPAFPDRWCTR